MTNSPLRYPGGKKKLSGFIAKICLDNNINYHYIEPYAGGASVALFLLMEGFVKKVTINDKDRSIYAVWFSILNHSEELCELIESTEITVNEWYKQKAVQKNKDNADLLELGFSTLFLNRTNRSGIINAGLIGGKDQKGEYKIDCRFNKSEIIKRVRKIAEKKRKISLYNEDALILIDKIEKKLKNGNAIFYFDPPYYFKADSLYLNYYKDSDHRAISERIKRIKNIHWVISYDNVPEIMELYSDCSKKEYSLNHAAYKTREGKEILFFNKNLIVPATNDWNPLNFKLKRYVSGKKIIYQS